VFRVGHTDVRRERSVHKYLHMSQSLLVVLVIKRVIELDIRGSVHHSAVPYRKNQQDATLYQNFIIPCFK